MSKYEVYDWVDRQTADEKPAVMMIYEPDAQFGHVYLANGPAFDVPVIAALEVPREIAPQIGRDIEGLFNDCRNGMPMYGGQEAILTYSGLHMLLVEPTEYQRRKLLRDELCQSYFRWPQAEVLLLETEEVMEVGQ
jgi:hypothetical protein